jgi:hyaluronoglucosaminidase
MNNKIILTFALLLFSFSNAEYAQSPTKNVFYKGIVEGFYGKPYTHSQRLEMIGFLGKAGFNYYIYGPKDDSYHRHDWKTPYPENALKRLKELIDKCVEKNIIFCFALSPGLSLKYSGKNDFKLFMEKYLSLYKLGVRHFSLFLDDIPKKLKYQQDKDRFDNLYDAHIYFVNKLYKALKALDGSIFLSFVPTEYHGLEDTDYLTQIGKKINKDIPICWTGKSIVSKSILEDDLIKISVILKRKIFIWDNYPVNDYNSSVLFMDAIRNRSSKIKDYAAIYVANPMNQAEASKIPLFTINDMLKNKNYSPRSSLYNAILKFSGLTSERKEVNYLRHFISLFQDSKLHRNTDTYLKKRIQDFLLHKSKPSSSYLKKEAVKNFIALLKKYYYMKKVLAGIGNRSFIKEIHPWLAKLKLLAAASTKAISLYLDKNTAKAYFDIIALRKKYSSINKNIGMFYLENFINSAISYYKRKNNKTAIKITTDMQSDFTYKKSLIIDNDTTTYFKSASKIKDGNYIQIDFPVKMRIRRIVILSSAIGYSKNFIKNAFLEASTDGKNFTRHASVEGRKYTLYFAGNVSLKAIRITFQKDYNFPLVLREIIINKLD